MASWDETAHGLRPFNWELDYPTDRTPDVLGHTDDQRKKARELDDGDRYEQQLNRDDRERHARLAGYLRELAEALAKLEMEQAS